MLPGIEAYGTFKAITLSPPIGLIIEIENKPLLFTLNTCINGKVEVIGRYITHIDDHRQPIYP